MIMSSVSHRYNGQAKSKTKNHRKIRYFRNFTNVINHALYLQQASSRGAYVGYCLVLYSGNQQRCEQDVRHLPIKEIHSVVRL